MEILGSGLKFRRHRILLGVQTEPQSHSRGRRRPRGGVTLDPRQGALLPEFEFGTAHIHQAWNSPTHSRASYLKAMEHTGHFPACLGLDQELRCHRSYS